MCEIERGGGPQTPLAANVGRTQTPEFQVEANILCHRHVRIESIVLENHGDIAIDRLEVIDPLPSIRMSPDVTASSPPIMLSVVVFAAARRPEQRHDSRSAIVKSISRHTLTGPYALLTFN